MKKQAKVMAVALVAAMAMFTFAGCGSSNTSSTSSGSADSSSSNSGEVYNIGICQQLEHPALDEATEGFEEAVKDKLGEDNVNFDLENAQGEQANCSTICSGFVSDGVDLIMANATSALQAAAAATDTIPIVGTSVTDYATALDISDWTGKTGKNITGTSDLAPLDQQAEMIQEIAPDANQVGLLYCSAEPNSTYQIENISKELDKLGMKYKEYSAADSNEIQSVTTKAASECDVIYIPTDNTMASNTEIINNITEPAKIPVVCGEEGICKGCGDVTLSINYHDIGYAAGEQAADILLNGTDPGTIDIEFAKNVTKLYNPEITEAIGLEVPDGYEAIDTSE
ncbi:MAG: ABC transporter substrate-binding protein [Anaerovoracaceae bacterium]|jgi:putative ABC transport system substrate-binding protein